MDITSWINQFSMIQVVICGRMSLNYLFDEDHPPKPRSETWDRISPFAQLKKFPV